MSLNPYTVPVEMVLLWWKLTWKVYVPDMSTGTLSAASRTSSRSTCPKTWSTSCRRTFSKATMNSKSSDSQRIRWQICRFQFSTFNCIYSRIFVYLFVIFPSVLNFFLVTCSSLLPIVYFCLQKNFLEQKLFLYDKIYATISLPIDCPWLMKF